MACTNAFKVLQSFLLKNKEGDLIQNGRNKGKQVLVCFFVLYSVCFFFHAKNIFPEVVSLDDAQKCG